MKSITYLPLSGKVTDLGGGYRVEKHDRRSFLVSKVAAAECSYVVDVEDGTCTCDGYLIGMKCKHLNILTEMEEALCAITGPVLLR